MTIKLNSQRCQCAKCKRHFASTAAFDQHRAWHPGDPTSETNRRRICLDPAEVGLADRDGVWADLAAAKRVRDAFKGDDDD